MPVLGHGELKLNPHDFRRLFASEAVSSGLPPHIVAKILSHEHLSTTEHYMAVYPEDMLRHYRAFLARRRPHPAPTPRPGPDRPPERLRHAPSRAPSRTSWTGRKAHARRPGGVGRLSPAVHGGRCRPRGAGKQAWADTTARPLWRSSSGGFQPTVAGGAAGEAMRAVLVDY
ncbi:tyrosine-type recombinase/integrase [Streptomyces sp. NPDC057908]|uniref:tyrosine-type recombinase/integrase n=1 Tax=Streptomyces sp. NPDC057908 TaxID=3346276 RepID=UPI0036E3AE18